MDDYDKGYIEGFKDGYRDGLKGQERKPIPQKPFEPWVDYPYLSKPSCQVCWMTFVGDLCYVCSNRNCPSGISCSTGV